MAGLPSRLSWILLASALLAPPSAADDDRRSGHDRARTARIRGEALPLAQILAAVERDFQGRVIEVELERDDGRLVYELELLVPDGRVVELKYDARSGALVKIEGARLESILKPGRRAGAEKP